MRFHDTAEEKYYALQNALLKEIDRLIIPWGEC